MRLTCRTVTVATAGLTAVGLLTAGVTAAYAVAEPAPPGVNVVAAKCGATGSHWMAMRFTAGATAVRLLSNSNPGNLGARLVSNPGYEQGPGRTLVMNVAEDLHDVVNIVLEVTGAAAAAHIAVRVHTGHKGGVGGPGIDFMLGSDADSNAFDGGEGQDVLCGMGSHDSLNGGPGDDLVFGGAGNDRTVGADGNDLLLGEAGDDYVEGGAGDDFMCGGPAGAGAGDNDEIQGGPGRDVVGAVHGGDKVYGGADADSIAVAGGARVLDREDGDRVVVTPLP
ncbi:calcium-binding protein [Pilimelia terevasa]|nr:calcium-binding protein [Pilimelia terevasa]